MTEQTPEHQVHLMVDIETMGTSPDAVILSIGLVRFTEADGETISWWLTQPEHARRALRGLQRREDGHGGLLEADALKDFCRSVMQTADIGGFWANGIDFDLVILRAALARHKLPLPWPYWLQRDYRTLRRMMPHVPTPPRDEALKHSALADAMHQAAHCAALLRALRTTAPAEVQP